MSKYIPLPWPLSLLASILLHVLLFFIWWIIIQLKLINFEVKPTPPLENESIVFYVIETPEDAKEGEHQKKVKFLSDKNALAKNPETKPNLDIGEAHAKGDHKSYDLQKKHGVQDEKKQKPVPLRKAKGEGEAEKESVTGTKENLKKKRTAGGYISPDLPEKNGVRDGKEQKPVPDKKSKEEEEKEKEKESVTKAKENLKKKGAAILDYTRDYLNMKPVFEKREPGVTPHDHQQTRVIDIGGLSHDTKDGGDIWRYLQALKKKIQGNIHPPGAHTSWRLSMNGETRLRFKIYKNGELKDLEILEHKGHKPLKITSVNAIELSAPFPELPPGFTEPYLEVTVNIEIIIEGK